MPVPGVSQELARELEHVGLQVGVRRGAGAGRDLPPSAVAGSIVSAYALTCSGASTTASRSVRSHESIVSPSVP